MFIKLLHLPLRFGFLSLHLQSSWHFCSPSSLSFSSLCFQTQQTQRCAISLKKRGGGGGKTGRGGVKCWNEKGRHTILFLLARLDVQLKDWRKVEVEVVVVVVVEEG